MKQPPETLTTAELEPYAREWMRRTRKPPDRSKFLPCIYCGKPLNATERRAACKHCGKRNPRPKSRTAE